MCSYFLKTQANSQVILINLTQIQSVLPILKFQKVPEEYSKLLGILNFQGESVPAYDINLLIEDGKTNLTINTPLILCEFNHHKITFVITDIIEVVAIDSKSLQKPAYLNEKSYIKGIYEHSQDKAWVLDVELLITYHKLENGRQDD